MDFVSKITQSHEVSKSAKRGFDSLYPLHSKPLCSKALELSLKVLLEFWDTFGTLDAWFHATLHQGNPRATSSP